MRLLIVLCVAASVCACEMLPPQKAVMAACEKAGGVPILSGDNMTVERCELPCVVAKSPERQ